MEASGGIGREGWRTLNGGQWRDWQRGVEDTGRLVWWMSLAAAFMTDWRGDSLCKGKPIRRECSSRVWRLACKKTR
ncbi:unnamed protein product [Staurois parvus]|uniref:Uncharacterized protein n=1 Tax=Staurois parvus TaxID=386267 RepID=A0ABN9BRM7_9NEOB|nr:unnamed protein product [Staurois parvus]